MNQFDNANNEAGYVPDDMPDFSILEAAKPDYPVFPLEIFTLEVRLWIETEATLKACPVEYVVGGLLACLASLIGTSRAAQTETGFSVYAIMWSAIIGKPSSRKTPALGNLIKMLQSIEAAKGKGYEKLLAEWEEDTERVKIAMKLWKKAVESEAGSTEKKPVLPPMPVRPRNMVNDLTLEIMGSILEGNPKGILRFTDELVSLLDMNRYNNGGGAERGFYLSAKTGETVTIDRVKHKDNPIFIPMAAVSILGGIQPEKLIELTGGADDGFAARFLYFIANYRQYKRPETGLKQDHIPLKKAMVLLDKYRHDMEENSKTLLPRVLLLDKQAENLFHEWFEAHDIKTSIKEGKLNGFYGKMAGEALKIALILECLQAALEKRNPTRITHENMKNALKAIDFYFIPTAKIILGGFGDVPHQREARSICQYILKHKIEGEVTATEIRTVWKLAGLEKAADVMAALAMVEDMKWIAREGIGMGGQKGRKWKVNPKVLSSSGLTA